jgi:hypothetical protein
VTIDNYWDMSQRDPWGSAVVCAMGALAARDPHKRALLTYLGEFWLTLARYDTSQISKNLAIDVAVIERMQAELLGESTAIH